MDAINPKDILGEKKPSLHLIPAPAEIAESMAMSHGARKYGEFNWREKVVKASCYVSAARRHLAQWFDGQDDDPESGVSHLAHVRACMGILLDAQAIGNLGDDRPKPGAAAKLIQKYSTRAWSGDDPVGDDIALGSVPRPAVSPLDEGG